MKSVTSLKSASKIQFCLQNIPVSLPTATETRISYVIKTVTQTERVANLKPVSKI